MKKIVALFIAMAVVMVRVNAQSTNAPPHPIVSAGAHYLENRATLYAITRTGLPVDMGNNTLSRWRASIEARGLATPTSLTPDIIAEAQRFRAAMLATQTPTLSPN
jgi:hypothetical protein